jgi:hypothetical protein
MQRTFQKKTKTKANSDDKRGESRTNENKTSKTEAEDHHLPKSRSEEIEEVKRIVDKINAIVNNDEKWQAPLLTSKQPSCLPANRNNLATSTSAERKRPQKSRQKESVTASVKDADKTILRCKLARKVKNVEAAAKSRGYSSKSTNWLR